MEKEKYYELINELEIYFADVIKKRFKEYVNESFESNLHFAPDIQSHNLINDLLENEGFEVYGMNVNMDGFQLLLDFKYTYLKIENFMFTRLAVDFKNDGNYTVYLDTNSFEDNWTANLVDDFHRYFKMTEDDLEKLIRDIKKTHLMLILKRD
jgi:hypothetical protein